MDNKNTLATISNNLFNGINHLIENAQNRVAIFLNSETTLLYWSIGQYINTELKENDRLKYGAKILATLSQELTKKHGKGYTYTALTRMGKVAIAFKKENIATVSQQLSWSHLIELAAIENETKRLYYTIVSANQTWAVRKLRDEIDAMAFERSAIAKKPGNEIIAELKKASSGTILNPDLVFKNSYVFNFLGLSNLHTEKELENAIISHLEKFIMELGSDFAFLERQKRISVDAVDYYLDLLFYHRKLNRLVVIDLKIGKFKPKYKAQMELYLRYLQKYEQQKHEEAPIGLLLCSEGNTEHIELLLLDEENIRVAQYLNELPDKQWFIEKMHRAIEISKMNLDQN